MKAAAYRPTYRSLYRLTYWLTYRLGMSIGKHICAIVKSAIVKSCFLQLRNFRYIRPFNSKTAVITLASAFVPSHFAYCNSLFYGLTNYSIHRLKKYRKQLLAYLQVLTSRFSYIMPILKSLHQLPVICRINFKICYLTHCAFSLSEPFYLRFLLTNRLNSHSPRSSFFNSLVALYFKKDSMAFVLFLMLYLFFGIIYLTLFVLLLHTYPLKKTLKNLFNLAFHT